MAVSTIKAPNYVNGAFNTAYLSANNIVDNGSRISRSGRIVMLVINLKSTGTAGTAQSTGEWIPQGFRPLWDMPIMVGDGGTTGQTIGIVKADGTATLYFGSTKYAQGTLTYIAS